MGKLFGRRTALTIQELADGRIDHSRIDRWPVLKILQWLYAMQELAIPKNLAKTFCKAYYRL